MIDWVLVAISVGGAIAFYWIGYFDGKSRGYWEGRKEGGRAAIEMFANALSGKYDKVNEDGKM